jgi:hypothetical protein
LIASGCGDDDVGDPPERANGRDSGTKPGGSRDASAGSIRDGGGSRRDAGQDPNVDDPCVVALHVVECCKRYEPLRRSEVDAVECLQAVPSSTVFSADLVRRCMMKAGASCDPARCNARPSPPSRVAVADGAACRYADECKKDGDCVPAVSIAGCCNCAEPLPAQLFAVNECVVDEGTPSREWPLGCAGCTLPVDCDVCAPSAKPRCASRDSLRVCTSAE